MSQHLDPSAFVEALEGARDESVVLAAVSHLRGCSECRALLRNLPEDVSFIHHEILSGRYQTERYPSKAYTGALDSVCNSVAEESSRLDRERARAPQRLKELEALSSDRQPLLVRNSPKFQNWGLVEYLLQESRESWTEDPRRAEQLARTAVLVIDHLPAEGFRGRVLNDLAAEAWSYIGNCLRIQTGLDRALEAFERSEEYLSIGTGDALERARFWDLKSSLLRECRDFVHSKRLLVDAIAVYQEQGERRFQARGLMKLGKLLSDAGAPSEECLAILERASSLLTPEEDPFLHLFARMHFAYYLNETGRSEEANAELPEIRVLAHAHGSRFDRLRLLWIEGLICRSLGKVELAEEALKQVREGFIGAEIGYDVALVSLDLATLYLESGRTAEAKDLAAEMLPQFAARQIQREALAAISLFEQAARQECATVAMVQQVASTVKDRRGRQGSVES